jgi:hypothetical protein
MTEIQQLQWVQKHLGEAIRAALKEPYTENWLIAMAVKETGVRIAKQGSVPDWSKFKGDYTKRPKDTEKMYHGFGPWQADVNTAPAWIASGAWKDPFKAAEMAVKILGQKRAYLKSHTPLVGDALDRANTAAYNCGEGNVVKVIARGLDIDAYTAHANYSKDVWRLRDLLDS